MMRTLQNNETIPCNECPAGKMHLRPTAYFTWLDDEMIIVSDFPCWVCDICGHREYDSRSMRELNLLLSPNAGTPSNRSRRPPLTPNVPKAPRPSRPD